MKTLKISIVATLAATLAWWLHIPQRAWPTHPYFADFLMALALCLLLQLVWSEPTATTKEREHP